MDEYEVKSTMVKRIDVRHRVFTDSKARAIDLVLLGKGERVSREERFVEKTKHTAKKVRR